MVNGDGVNDEFEPRRTAQTPQ